jgi:hypothetical protein
MKLKYAIGDVGKKEIKVNGDSYIAPILKPCEPDLSDKNDRYAYLRTVADLAPCLDDKGDLKQKDGKPDISEDDLARIIEGDALFSDYKVFAGTRFSGAPGKNQLDNIGTSGKISPNIIKKMIGSLEYVLVNMGKLSKKKVKYYNSASGDLVGRMLNAYQAYEECAKKSPNLRKTVERDFEKGSCKKFVEACKHFYGDLEKNGADIKPAVYEGLVEMINKVADQSARETADIEGRGYDMDSVKGMNAANVFVKLCNKNKGFKKYAKDKVSKEILKMTESMGDYTVIAENIREKAASAKYVT